MKELLLSRRTEDQLSRILQNPGSAYAFAGPKQVGKFTTALSLARALNCPSGRGEDGCEICRQFKGLTFADLLIVAPTDKASIGISQIHDLQGKLAHKLYPGSKYRVVIVD